MSNRSLIVLSVLLTFLSYILYVIHMPLFEDDAVVLINKKDSVDIIYEKMQEIGTQQSIPFWTIATIYKYFFKIRPGEHFISKQWNVFEVLKQFSSGKLIKHKITIPEGYTLHQIVEALNNNQDLSGEINHIYPEGTVLPSTYDYKYGDSRQKILNNMKKEMDKVLRKVKSDMSKMHILTLASIVEKETSVPHERGLIAKVFLNRLRLKMPLQSDPTVIYAITKGQYKLTKPLSRQDLKYKSPYNTYVNKGLPPGPIACPGIESIMAVINPTSTDALYFVAKVDGGHSFSDNLKSHNEHVKKWRSRES